MQLNELVGAISAIGFAAIFGAIIVAVLVAVQATSTAPEVDAIVGNATAGLVAVFQQFPLVGQKNYALVCA